MSTCYGCQSEITPNDRKLNLFIRSHGYMYHLNCFRCGMNYKSLLNNNNTDANIDSSQIEFGCKVKLSLHNVYDYKGVPFCSSCHSKVKSHHQNLSSKFNSRHNSRSNTPINDASNISSFGMNMNLNVSNNINYNNMNNTSTNKNGFVTIPIASSPRHSTQTPHPPLPQPATYVSADGTVSTVNHSTSVASAETVANNAYFNLINNNKTTSNFNVSSSNNTISNPTNNSTNYNYDTAANKRSISKSSSSIGGLSISTNTSHAVSVAAGDRPQHSARGISKSYNSDINSSSNYNNNLHYNSNHTYSNPSPGRSSGKSNAAVNNTSYSSNTGNTTGATATGSGSGVYRHLHHSPSSHTTPHSQHSQLTYTERIMSCTPNKAMKLALLGTYESNCASCRKTVYKMEEVRIGKSFV